MIFLSRLEGDSRRVRRVKALQNMKLSNPVLIAHVNVLGAIGVFYASSEAAHISSSHRRRAHLAAKRRASCRSVDLDGVLVNYQPGPFEQRALCQNTRGLVLKKKKRLRLKKKKT